MNPGHDSDAALSVAVLVAAASLGAFWAGAQLAVRDG